MQASQPPQQPQPQQRSQQTSSNAISVAMFPIPPPSGPAPLPPQLQPQTQTSQTLPQPPSSNTSPNNPGVVSIVPTQISASQPQLPHYQLPFGNTSTSSTTAASPGPTRPQARRPHWQQQNFSEDRHINEAVPIRALHQEVEPWRSKEKVFIDTLFYFYYQNFHEKCFQNFNVTTQGNYSQIFLLFYFAVSFLLNAYLFFSDKNWFCYPCVMLESWR